MQTELARGLEQLHGVRFYCTVGSAFVVDRGLRNGFRQRQVASKEPLYDGCSYEP